MTTARGHTESDQADQVTPEDTATSESPKERVDRELGELLQGLRVALPGVQVLFAFGNSWKHGDLGLTVTLTLSSGHTNARKRNEVCADFFR